MKSTAMCILLAITSTLAQVELFSNEERNAEDLEAIPTNSRFHMTQGFPDLMSHQKPRRERGWSHQSRSGLRSPDGTRVVRGHKNHQHDFDFEGLHFGHMDVDVSGMKVGGLDISDLKLGGMELGEESSLQLRQSGKGRKRDTKNKYPKRRKHRVTKSHGTEEDDGYDDGGAPEAAKFEEFEDKKQLKSVTVTKEVALPVPKPYPVPLIKKVPVPYPKPVPVPIDKPYPVYVPYKVMVPVIKHVPYPVHKPVPYKVQVPVQIPVNQPVPVHVPKPVPYTVHVPIKVPVPQYYPVPKPVVVKSQDHEHEEHNSK